MNNANELTHQPDTLQQPSLWKAIYIPLLIPLLMLNLAPIAVILFASNEEYSGFASLALIPSLFISTTVDLVAILIYTKICHPQGRAKTIIRAALIVIALVLVYSGFVIIYWVMPYLGYT